jgi:hypothetical protein
LAYYYDECGARRMLLKRTTAARRGGSVKGEHGGTSCQSR